MLAVPLRLPEPHGEAERVIVGLRDLEMETVVQGDAVKVPEGEKLVENVGETLPLRETLGQ